MTGPTSKSKRVVKRLISDEKKAKLAGSKAHKGANTATMSDADLRDLVRIIAEKMGLI